MSDFVTATPSIVGFTNDRDRGYGYGFNQGISDKDQMFAMSIDGGEQTRDLLEAIAATDVAIEKIGAAGVLESAKNAAALHVQIATSAAAAAATAASNQQAAMMYANSNASAAFLFASQNQATLAAQIAECCCDSKALMLSIESARIRDELIRTQNELLAARVAGITPPVIT